MTIRKRTSSELETPDQPAQEVPDSAVNQVWVRFSDAIKQLDPESGAIFLEFLEGSSVASLASDRQLTEQQARAWLDNIKREVTNHLRSKCKVRN